ncbi:MAG: putative glutamate/gamma-aminobutyrate antiporter [Chlamydiia bacterium]|nr:putative glutamate/gamma-aminobutyrate antiporter [Chlamydiia bacterium]
MSFMKKKKTLSLFAITMINIIAVDSIRTLPISAQYGFSLVFYYLVGGLFFLIPSALIAAELGTGWPETGGLYVWIKEAFGKKTGAAIIWLNWIYNLAWYPTIMALIAGISAYLINPALAKNKYYMITVILALFWLATLLNCYGMRLSSWISTVGAIFGTLLPMAFIIILSFIFYYQGKPLAIEISSNTFFPSSENLDKLGFFSSILFGLLGLEMAATHAGEMTDPKRDYPKSLFISVIIILSSIIFSSLAIAAVVPARDLNLVVGILQAFKLFFTVFNIPYFTYIIAAAIIIGALSGVSAWIIGPTKGIMVASMDKALPKFLTRRNKHGVPSGALVTQGLVVTLLSFFYLFMPSVNSTFIFLSILTAQLAMIVYITLFAAGIVLHHKKRHVKRAFKIPGGNMGIWITGASGILISSFAFFLGFIPPKAALITNIYLYEALLVGVMIVITALPLLLSKISAK